MKRKLRTMFLAVEVNLLLWLALAGMAWTNAHETGGSWWRGPARVDASLLLIGVGFSLIAQHWAYYAIHKAAE